MEQKMKAKHTRFSVASWARSMAQLMEREKVTALDVEMLLDAHGLETQESKWWVNT